MSYVRHALQVFAVAILSIFPFSSAYCVSVEDYGVLPGMDLVTISPSGRLLASRQTRDGRDLIAVYDLEKREYTRGVDISGIGARALEFVNDETLIITAGKTTRAYGFRGSWDFSAAFSLNLETGKVFQMLRKSDELYPAQGGLGHIVGYDTAKDRLLMPAYVGERYNEPRYSLLEANLDRDRSRIREHGSVHTIDWFVDENGEALLREDMNNDKDIYRIIRYREGKKEVIFESEGEIAATSIVGLTPDRSAAVISGISGETGRWNFLSLDLESGDIRSLFSAESSDVERVIVDINRIVHGVEFAGFKPSYLFFDDDLNSRLKMIADGLSSSAVRLESWNDDFSKLILHVSGGKYSGAYMLLKADAPMQPIMIGAERPTIDEALIAPIEVMTYAARDGLEIPALVTATRAVRAMGKAPLVVLPHGGPAAHDRYGFDWLSQFLANEGYVVLQPQFRGSDGFGRDHLRAGYGEWGKKMQTDLDDGVAMLIETGLVDPDRVCIVGASYGGYAALAAATFSSDIYRCAVSINGVSDLPKMLKEDIRDHGRDHWVIAYWERQYGSDLGERKELTAISPARHADAVKIPVMLIHANKDTVVSIDQSRLMNRELKKAGKEVELVVLKGEDHWLTYEDTRMATLKALERFLAANL